MEVIGGISACLELGEAAAKFLKLLKRLHDAPKLVASHISKVQEIEDINRGIADNAALQTEDVLKGVRACFKTIERLYAIFQKFEFMDKASSWQKMKSRVASVSGESHTQELFKELETNKMDLLLRLSARNAGELWKISELCNDIQQHIHDRAAADSLQQKDPSPDDEKQIYNVPSRHASCFIGRKELLSKLAGAVLQSPTHETEDGFGLGTKTFVIRALGGQGKSQIALHLCRRLRASELFAILWIDAASENSLQSQFEGIAVLMQEPGHALTTTQAKVGYVKNKLQRSRRPWLLVLDNFDEPDRIPNVRDYIPDNAMGTVLITSRHSDSSSFATDADFDIELGGLREDEASDLLTKLSKTKPENAKSALPIEIVRSLAYHPLAITQAAAFVKKRKMDFREFELYYQRKKKDILNSAPNTMWSQYQRSKDGQEKELTMNVFTTWELSFQQLKSAIEEEADESDSIASSTILSLCAFAGHEGLSEDLLRMYVCPAKDDFRSYSLFSHLKPFLGPGLNGQPFSWNHDAYGHCVSRLIDFSLIQSSSLDHGLGSYKISLHPLVRDWLRLRVSDEEQRDLIGKTASVVGSSLIEVFDHATSTFPMSLGRRQEMLDHVKAIEENYANNPGAAPQASDDDSDVATLAHSIMQHSLQEPDSATISYEDKEGYIGASGIESRSSEKITSAAATASNAIANQERSSLEILQDLDQDLTLSCDDHGTMGDHLAGSVRTCARFCMTIYQAQLGASLIHTVFPDLEMLAEKLPRNRSLVWLSFAMLSCLMVQEKDREAELMALRLIKMCESWQDMDKEKYLPLYFCGTTLHNQGRFEEAVQMTSQALHHLTRTRGPHDSLTLSAAGNLALSLGRTGKIDDSQQLFKTTIMSMKKHLAPDTLITLDTEFKFIGILRTAGKIEEALELSRAILERAGKVFGEQHKETLRCMSVLAKNLESSGRGEEAKPLREKIAYLNAHLIC